MFGLSNIADAADDPSGYPQLSNGSDHRRQPRPDLPRRHEVLRAEPRDAQGPPGLGRHHAPSRRATSSPWTTTSRRAGGHASSTTRGRSTMLSNRSPSPPAEAIETLPAAAAVGVDADACAGAPRPRPAVGADRRRRRRRGVPRRRDAGAGRSDVVAGAAGPARSPPGDRHRQRRHRVAVEHHLAGADAARRARRHRRGDAVAGRRQLPGRVPQPARRSVPARRGGRRRARGDAGVHRLARARRPGGRSTRRRSPPSSSPSSPSS